MVRNIDEVSKARFAPAVCGVCLVMSLTGGVVLAQVKNEGSGSVTVELREREFFSRGSFSAFAFTFAAMGRPDLVPGRDFGGRWTLDPAAFPDGAELHWTVPPGAVPENLGVWGYHHIDFGNYDQSIQRTPVPPVQVCNIGRFIQSYRATWTGSERFNLLAELWLTDTGSTMLGNSKRASLEVGFLMHAPELGFHDRGRAIGSEHLNSGLRYTVRQNGRFVTFAPVAGPVPGGVIDWAAALGFLVENGVVKGSEWVNGVAFGVEPVRSRTDAERSGSFKVERLNVELEAGKANRC